MSITLRSIKAPIEGEMKEFEKHFYQSMKTRVALLDRIMTYIVKNKGKQMRPMFVFLSAGVSGKINEKTFRGASLVELLHTATLIHDDVVDDSFERRGLFSINALWKNKIAVLVGDYLLSRGLLLSLENKDHELLGISSNAVKLMSEGELLQIEKSRNMNVTEEIYFDIIRMKTASLIAACCSIGAASSGGEGELTERMRLFGEKVGIAFQIKDDLFDYGDNNIGKPRGIDIQEKKLTLPLIHALSKVSTGEQKEIKNLIKRKGAQKKNLRKIINFVNENGGIEYAKEKMYAYREEAFKLIEDLPQNEYKNSLIDLVNFTTERKK